MRALAVWPERVSSDHSSAQRSPDGDHFARHTAHRVPETPAPLLENPLKPSSPRFARRNFSLAAASAVLAACTTTGGGKTDSTPVAATPTTNTPPLDKPQMNTYTRFLARKLMLDMSNAWAATAPGDAPAVR